MPRTLPSVAIPKPKFSLLFLLRRGVWGVAKDGKEIFDFGPATSILECVPIFSCAVWVWKGAFQGDLELMSSEYELKKE